MFGPELTGVPIERGQCSHCCRQCHCDIYEFKAGKLKGKTLCGDCRYFQRHGRLPQKETRPRVDISEVEAHRYHGGYGSETLHRFRETECISERHMEELLRIEQENRGG